MNAQTLANVFHMTDRVWEHHANPWSVWTRYTGLPLIAIALWSRVWLGWLAIAPIAAVILWIWLNPRIFPKPATTKHWASKAVLGERVWLNQKQIPIPRHHQPLIRFTNAVSAIGAAIALGGIITLSVWATILGTSWVILGKTWFMDRMVWLYDEMKDRDFTYRSWLY
ncbi:MAG: DUF6653 family protein [Cyanobacteria bacterium P01_C01_bin.89]